MPDDAEIVTGEKLAEKFGLSTRKVRDLAEQLVISRDAPNRYKLWPSVLGYISHLREQAAGRAAGDDENGKPDLPTERALLARAQREGQNMKNAVLRGELLPIDDVEETVGAVLDAVRAKMLSIPSKGAQRCVGLDRLNAARDLLTELVHDALTDLADTPVVVAGAVGRARRRIGRRAASDTLVSEDEAAATVDGEPVG